MTAAQRREKIYQQLTTAAVPLSANALAKQYGVSRQIIVGDVALLRASGCRITATPRGYMIVASDGVTVQLPCIHTAQQTRDELYAMVDCGCTVQDVVIEHPVYGQLTAALQLSSRYDVDQYMEKMAQCEAQPLSLLTEGIHLHTIACPSTDVLAHLKSQLHRMGVLLEEKL